MLQNYAQQSQYLAGYVESTMLRHDILDFLTRNCRPIGLLKAFCTRAAQDTAKDATQVLSFPHSPLYLRSLTL